MNRSNILKTMLVGSACGLILASAAQAQVRTFDVPAGDLQKALDAYGAQSGVQLIYRSADLRGLQTKGVRGPIDQAQALERLLADSDLVAQRQASGAQAIIKAPRRPQGPSADAAILEPQLLSELVVTGTRIRGAGPVGSNLISISRRDIEASGYATTQQIVQALPQNYGGGPNDSTMYGTGRNGSSANLAAGSAINLRGLGASSTLVLLNGSRPPMGGRTGVFADISLVPSTAIERIEVLADGASALYGSDAVAGVVNVIFRDRFEGLSTQLRYGGAKGGAEEAQAGLLAGKTWSGGHVVVGYEVARRDALAASKRSYATSDLRPFGGPDYRSIYASPGTIVAGGQTFAIPAGQNGVALRPDQLIRGVTNKEDGLLDTDILPRQTRQALYVSADQNLGKKTNIFVQALLADRRFSFRTPTGSQSAVTVPVANPFYLDPIGTHQPVRVQYSFVRDLGPNIYSGHVRAYDLTGGLRRSFGSWSATARVGYGRQEEATLIKNYVNTYRLGLALADINPATAYNVFGDARSTPAATINSIRGFASSDSVYKAWSADVKADGPLFALPAGEARLAVGAEHRDERYRYDSFNDISAATPRASSLLLPGPRQIDAAFAELLVPLVDETMAVPGVRQLKVSLAGRIERYSDFGTTSNPKVGLDWEPVEGLVLKSAYGTSFRAPSFNDMRQGVGSTLYQPAPLSDPNSPTGSTVVLALIGNSPDIGPERAKTWTSTAEWKPAFAPGVKLTTSYFRVKYRDRIASINGDIFNALINRAAYSALLTDTPAASVVAGYYASPYFSNPSNIPASSVKVIVDARVQNLAIVNQDGLDVDIDYRRALGGGQINLGLAATYTFRVEQAVTENSAKVDTVGTVGSPVKLRWRARAGWTQGGFDAAAFVNFVDGYRNQTVTPNEHVDAWTTVDLTLGYRFTGGRADGLRASLAVANLFDRDPPYVNLRTSSSGIGFDSDNANPLGRTIAIQLAKSW